MILNPRVEGDNLVYDCTGEGCTSEDGTHKVPIDACVVAMISLVEELLEIGDPRAHEIAVAGVFFKQAMTGNCDVDLMNDPKYAGLYRSLFSSLSSFYGGRVADSDLPGFNTAKKLLN